MLLQLVFVAAAAIALWRGSRWINREAERVESQMRRVQRAMALAEVHRIPSLQYDSATGVYQPAPARIASPRLLGHR